MFQQHTLESAPEKSARMMRQTEAHFGYVPAGVSLLAESPEMLEGFLKANALFEASTLDPLSREVLVMTVAVRNGCHLCIALHTARLRGLTDAGTTEALRTGEPLVEPRLEAVRVFTLKVLETAGGVPDSDLEAFLAAGYTLRNALEVVLGIGTYTMSTFANRLTDAPVDAQLTAH